MMSPVLTCLLSIPRGGTIEMSRIRALAPDLLIASHGLIFDCLILHTAAIVLVFKEEDGL